MPFYQEVRTMRAAAIGTIMPWTGPISKIPDGWIICSGGSVAAADYPLLARAIQDNYNTGATSTFGGQFPSYQGDIFLPALTNRPLVDIEASYFGTGTGATGHPQDTPALAQTEITPYIGLNSDNGFSSTINNVVTDVVFDLTERTFPAGEDVQSSYYFGKVRGNTVAEGSGEASRTLFFGPRKLGRSHVKSHKHGGRNIETIARLPTAQPGEGVVPYGEITFNFGTNVSDPVPGPFGDIYELSYELVQTGPGGAARGAQDGWGSGPAGRVVAPIQAENPPINWTPQQCAATPIKETITEPSNIRTFAHQNAGGTATVNVLMDGLSGFSAGTSSSDNAGKPMKYGLNGEDIDIPNGQSSFYPDILYTVGFSANDVVSYDTLQSNAGWDFMKTSASVATQDQILSHTHDEFDVTFDRAGLKPDTSINVGVWAETGKLNLDNDRNVGVLQIDMNISQPGMSCIYVIRAY